MKSYGIKMIGKYILERVDGLPTFNSERDKGRLIYDDINKQAYFGSETKWISISPDRLRMTEHENRITQNESNISTLTDQLSDHIGSIDEHPTATTSLDGFMSGYDKGKLDNIDYDANNYSLEVHGNGHHTEDLLSSMNQYELNSVSDVTAPSPSNGESLTYNGSNWIADIASNVHTSFNSDWCALGDLKPGYTYLVIMEYIIHDYGTGYATLVRPRLLDSNNNTIAYSTVRNITINWPDGHVPRTSPFIVTAPSDGYVKIARIRSYRSDANAVAICLGKW